MRAVAVVGSRNPTPQGEQNSRQFARALAARGITIVSGLALGIDGAAHEGALEGFPAHPIADSPGEPARACATVAVVGTGIDRVYPRRHLALAHRIARSGLIVSEYPLGTPPLPSNFPKRNRLIAGLSRGTLVVEAALKSGSLTTARLAAEQGKEVFAIPGSIHLPQSRGCHALIRQGAKLVETAEDVLEELRWPESPAHHLAPETIASAAVLTRAGGRKAPPAQQPADSSTAGAGAPDDAVLRALGGDPADLDTLQARTGLDTPALLARLLELELQGAVGRLPGGHFQRMALG